MILERVFYITVYIILILILTFTNWFLEINVNMKDYRYYWYRKAFIREWKNGKVSDCITFVNCWKSHIETTEGSCNRQSSFQDKIFRRTWIEHHRINDSLIWRDRGYNRFCEYIRFVCITKMIAGNETVR